ncbi:acyl-CoA synthetase (AMP-forming)/AMP-acid ligase II [Antricoccus suffuscus]|uniref:Acyl-CoA synthetase (AMP-forming)/AMP-acid ligase II n=1 Tax=Antricoccus suffuscus TaxID=1629062 RepID=A0A2T1A376_9ACTN|nr:class I adenylate-forming enzyme family protein [Antricoccus suffuscus]PRZ42994.1 acyl-CoA synthetase (AMP-forming)/AMP-acid ligase II [Antricoccus suffuscus]
MKLHPEERVRDYVEAGYWGAPTWPQMLDAHIAATPDKLAIVDPANLEALCGTPPQQWTWRELGDYTDRLAAVLRDYGIGADDVVACALPNRVELAALYLAVAKLGAIVSPCPVQYRQHEYLQICAAVKPKVFVTVTAFADRALAAEVAAAKIPSVQSILAYGDERPDGVLSLDRLVSEAAPAQFDREPDGNDCVTVCWTSGTEAAPKGVPRCANDWYPMAYASIDAAELTGNDVLLNPFPMVNMAGIAGMFVPWLITGATLVQHHPFDPQTFFGQLAAHRVTYTVAPPALLMMVLAREDIPAVVFDSLRIVGSGSAPLSPHMTNGWKDRFGIEIINCFGSNEGVCIAGDPKTVPDQDLRATLFPRFGSPSHEWPNTGAHGMRSRIVDLGTGQQIDEADRTGEFRIKGPGVFAGYWPGTGSTDAFDEDGYFCTGDLFQYVADDSGDLRYLKYLDRAKDIIVRGGQNISAAEVEGLLVGHPAVAEVAVVGVPDEVYGERVCAVIVSSAGAPPTLESLVEFLRGSQIASYKLPESLHIVEALPRNPVGKILKREVRSMLG